MMNWHLIGALVALLGFAVLAGCSSQRALVAERGAEASDAALNDAEWYLCNASPIGAVKRRYGQDEEAAEAYTKLCDSVGQTSAVVGQDG